MSKERELLEKILATGWLNNTISCEVEELLAQPEQEPVAWMCNLMGDVVTYRPNVNNGYTPLYTSPPKREPLSDKDIGKGFLLTDVWHRYECFIAGVRFAEKAHGIG